MVQSLLVSMVVYGVRAMSSITEKANEYTQEIMIYVNGSPCYKYQYHNKSNVSVAMRDISRSFGDMLLSTDPYLIASRVNGGPYTFIRGGGDYPEHQEG